MIKQFTILMFVAGTVSLFGPVNLGRVARAQRGYRLPDVDIKQPIIWGATAASPSGGGLSFGGQDQASDDGRPHTRVMIDGRWQAIHRELRENNPLQPFHQKIQALRALQKSAAAEARRAFFQGSPAAKETRGKLAARQGRVATDLGRLLVELKRSTSVSGDYEAGQIRRAVELLQSAETAARSLATDLKNGAAAEEIRHMLAVVVLLEKAAETCDAEPPPRALNPLVYDKRSRLYVLFGGDHLDYLTNDTWVFDPARRQWRQRHPATAPPPRANHQLATDGNGTITLTGGYTYTSATGYVSGQYRDLTDGTWTYDVAENRWTGSGKGVAAGVRVYRSGPYHPDFYLQGPPPNAVAIAVRLEKLPVNTWTAMNPPKLPRLNRDWGTAVIDPDHDVMLRFSGGHSAHGGTDVLHYHFATNRWELCFPVEFPLGQLYANTRYPSGFNFNRRPWVTGHTYRSYAYDKVAGKMLFCGRRRHFYLYDPVEGDWIGRALKPEGMAYNSSFYTLTLCPTSSRLACWTKQGEIFTYDSQRRKWSSLKLKGDPLPGTVVDRSGMAYDAKRNRLLCIVKPYRGTYDGVVYAVALSDNTVRRLTPAGAVGMGQFDFLREPQYDHEHDLMLLGATLPPGDDGVRRTPAYDCANDRWVSLRLGGSDPSGEKGRNVSLGLMYDTRRKLYWAVDTNSQVYVLRLDPVRAAPSVRK